MMRARQDDPESIFLVDWQWCNKDDVPEIPFEHAFGSSHFDPDEFDFGQVGEIRQSFYPKAGSFLPGFLLGSHYCGTQEQWQEGWPAGVVGSPIIDNVPTCCVEDAAEFDFSFDFSFFS